MQTVAAGGGITLVPELAIPLEGGTERPLVFVPFPKPAPARTVSLAWRRSSPRSREFRLFGEALKRAR